MPARRMTLAIILALATVLAACDAEEPTEPVDDGSDRELIVPEGWYSYFQSDTFAVGLERGRPRTGATAAYLTSHGGEVSGFAHLSQAVRADEYRGERVRWTGWVRYEDVGAEGAGLWMRVDAAGETTAFDNMSGRRLTGTGDWQQVSVVLDVAEHAVGFQLGFLLSGPGDVVVDDFRLEIVDDDVPSTNLLTSPDETGTDSATIAGQYDRVGHSAVNLDFEGVPPLPDATVDFLRRTASPFSRTAPGDSDDDLEPLREMVGDARIVALGEGTHGTREFFQLKHRVFQFLVREMGFTHFAIEATWPEANDVNEYVLTGAGDPARLLSNLYFWTWNTQEVLDLIEWMREWNTMAAPERRVQFLGFDMQHPGAAIDTVVSFFEQVDTSNVRLVTERYACLDDYRNHGSKQSEAPAVEYASLPAETRDACREGLQEVFDLVEVGRAEYVSASSEPKYENALHSARVVQQFEHMIARYRSNGSTAAAGRARDAFMAENTQWLLDQAGPGARMMLWAHNYHISRVAGAQGDSLARAFGADYVNLGFLFGTGSFNAVAVGSASGGLQSWHVDFVPDRSLEAAFLATEEPRLLFDTREIEMAGPDAAPLHGPIAMRHIGAGFDPARETNYFHQYVFPRHYDLLMFVEEVTESTLLPFDD